MSLVIVTFNLGKILFGPENGLNRHFKTSLRWLNLPAERIFVICCHCGQKEQDIRAPFSSWIFHSNSAKKKIRSPLAGWIQPPLSPVPVPHQYGKVRFLCSGQVCLVPRSVRKCKISLQNHDSRSWGVQFLKSQVESGLYVMLRE